MVAAAGSTVALSGRMLAFEDADICNDFSGGNMVTERFAARRSAVTRAAAGGARTTGAATHTSNAIASIPSSLFAACAARAAEVMGALRWR
eukprot:3033517-Prymnesium_polylepis.2